ncbi:hypothetical protein B0H14DRAFT_2564756 [Mycena olivaceomarginata]|nr:hypothetical protein B0H14DRAFT_2564756 [Mycena olivaceomarginata]
MSLAELETTTTQAKKNPPGKRKRNKRQNGNAKTEAAGDSYAFLTVLPPKRTTDSTDLGSHNRIFRVAWIDADNSVLFQNSSCSDEIKLPVPIKWPLDDQGPRFTLPVGGDVLLAFKRIAAQMPRAARSDNQATVYYPDVNWSGFYRYFNTFCGPRLESALVYWLPVILQFPDQGKLTVMAKGCVH